MERPEEVEQATASALEAHRPRGRPRKEQQPPFSSGQKRKDPPTMSEYVTPKEKQRRVNWSKCDNRAKLEAALSKWKEEALDENGEALTLLAFANIEGIPERTFRKDASGKIEVGASFGRKGASSKEASSPLTDLIVRHDPPPAREDVAPREKQRRVNWSKCDNRAKLEAALSKWKEEALDENGEALTLLAFANIEGIPERTFRKYASGKIEVGAYVGRKSASSKKASSPLIDLIVRRDPPPVREDVSTKEKQRRVNWSKGDNRAKLEATLSKWKEEPLEKMA